MKNHDTQIGIAQINSISGALEYNAKQIMENITRAQNSNLDLIIFPDLALSGIGLNDVINRYPILVDNSIKWLNEIAKITTNTTAVIGFIDKTNLDFVNAIAVINNGKIQTIIHKSHPQNIIVNGYTYKLTINDDIFNLNNCDSDAIINCCTSISRTYKSQKNQTLYSNLAKSLSTPIIYVNQAGANDSFVLDGNSKIFDKNGNILIYAKAFEQDFISANPFILSEKNIERYQEQTDFSLDYEFDLERTYKTICKGIKDYFDKTGLKRAVLGLSGGLDSTVCAVLLADALGAENVFGISMPSKLTSNESKTDAELLANNLGINFAEISIKDMVNTTDNTFQNLFETIEQKWNYRYKQSFTMDNIQARARATILFGVSNEFESCIPIATSDKSESYMGYATINGDMSGGIAPIADVTKTKLFALARWLNKNRKIKNAIPESIIQKRPGAELAIDPKTGKTLFAEDALMPYEFMDEVIWRIENKNENYNQILDAEFIYEKNNNISKTQKVEWLDKFYKRMSTAIFKWSILPPSIIVDSHSINKLDYHQPITSSKIDYKSLSIEKLPH